MSSTDISESRIRTQFRPRLSQIWMVGSELSLNQAPTFQPKCHLFVYRFGAFVPVIDYLIFLTAQEIIMRLLNTRSRRLQEFHGSDLPEYAILSHTWEDEEILYQDLYNGAYVIKKGWYKISNCCKTAARDGWEWVWIDTCCI